MAKAELKTRETNASVKDFLNGVAEPQKREDAVAVCEMMKRLSGETPKMWGPSIVGFGSTLLKYASGRELDWPKIGFSPRKQNLSLYLTCDINRFSTKLKKLGKYKTGVGCLYIKTLSDVDMAVLEDLIKTALAACKKG